jgi:hypothetical protein
MIDDPRERAFHGYQPESANWSCLFAERRDDPRCGKPATWHGLILTWDCTALRDVTACCDEHVANMRAVVDFTHALQTECGLPGSMCHWDGSTGESWCEFDWDMGLLAAADVVPVGVGDAR